MVKLFQVHYDTQIGCLNLTNNSFIKY